MTDIALSGKARGSAPAAANRHIVDQLADVRAAIKDLEAIEADLKARVSAEMGERDALAGDEFIAFQKLTSRKGGLDEARLRAEGHDPDDFRKPDSAVVTIKVERRAVEAA